MYLEGSRQALLTRAVKLKMPILTIIILAYVVLAQTSSGTTPESLWKSFLLLIILLNLQNGCNGEACYGSQNLWANGFEHDNTRVCPVKESQAAAIFCDSVWHVIESVAHCSVQ